MPRTIRPATRGHAFAIRECVQRLKAARVYATKADSPKAVQAIRRALKSAEGAMRHMNHRINRTKETTS